MHNQMRGENQNYFKKVGTGAGAYNLLKLMILFRGCYEFFFRMCRI